MLLLRALSPQGDVDLFSLLKSDSVVRAAEIAYLVEYFDRHVGRSRRGRRGAAPLADLDHDAFVERVESNTDEASLRRLKLHVVRLLAVENATLTPRCFKMGAGLLKGAMLSALGLFSLGSSHHFGIPRKLGCQLSAHPRLWAYEPGHRAEVGCRGRLPRHGEGGFVSEVRQACFLSAADKAMNEGSLRGVGFLFW